MRNLPKAMMIPLSELMPEPGPFAARLEKKHEIEKYVACWLQAAERRIVIYFGFTSSSGNWDAEFPLLEVLRTHADEPWAAAYDPKRKCVSEP